MPHLLATRPPSAPVRPIDPDRRSALLAVGLGFGAVGLAQAYFLFVPALSLLEQYAGFVGFQLALLGILVLAARLERCSLRDFGFTRRGDWSTTVGFSAMLVLVAVDLRLDPGFLFGFGRTLPIDPATFGYLLFTAPLVAIAEVGLYFGYVFRTLARTIGLRNGMLLSAAGFALLSTNVSILPLLGTTDALQYLFSTTVVSFVSGLVLALFCYKSQWSVVGPVLVWAGLLATEDLLPVAAAYPSWEIAFVDALVTGAVLLFLVAVGLREPQLQSRRYLGERIGPRRYRFRLRARGEAQGPGLYVAGAVAGVAILSVAYGLPTVLGTSQPLLAVATGSMAPTLERGTLVVVEHASPGQIVVGTIIVFDVSCLPSPTVHRVIKIVESGPDWVYQTKGDANKAQDPCTVPYADVRGLVVAHAPYVGYFILDPLFAASVIALVVVVPWAWRVGRS